MALLRGCDFPEDRLYHPDYHLWFAAEAEDVFRVGVTPFGAAIAGEILLFTAKPLGVALAAGRSFGLLEAGKTVFPVKTPFDCVLVDADEALERDASAINRAPNATWLVRLRATDPARLAGVLLPWDEAAPAIEALMALYRFTDLADFVVPTDGRRAGV